MRIRIGGVDHWRLRPTALIGQLQQHPGGHAYVALPLPTVAECLRRTVCRRSVTPAQVIAVDEDHLPKNQAEILRALQATALVKEVDGAVPSLEQLRVPQRGRTGLPVLPPAINPEAALLRPLCGSGVGSRRPGTQMVSSWVNPGARAAS